MDDAASARKVVHGECVVMGEECFDVLETPGHSPCSLTVRWRDRVLTGHTLLAGKAGPCNRPDSDPGQLFDSIHEYLYTLPPAVKIFPGFRLENGESSIGRERSDNKELNAHTERTSFLEKKVREQGAMAGMARPFLAHRAGNLYPYA